MIRQILFTLALLLSSQASAQHPWTEIEFHDNEGVKWQLSEPMRPHVRASEILLLEKRPKSLAQTKKMFRMLWKHSDRIAKTCAVEGEGHAYFHAWYVPYYKHLENLRDELFYEDALTIIEELKTGFEIYHKYFE